MKTDIQPKYYQAKATCTCGNEFIVGSTKEEIKLDICSGCHPFFTGKQKFVDTAGRVDKYFQKFGEDAQKKYSAKKKKRKRFSDDEVSAMDSDSAAPEDSDNEAAEAEEAIEAVAEAATEPEAAAAEETEAADDGGDQKQDS